MKIVLISTYELGRKPFGLVSPAAWLRRRGHAVSCFDLTRQGLDSGAVGAAELIAFYLPMHTATRLACKLIPSLLAQNSRAHVCCYGLYAPMNAEYLRLLGVGTILGGEFEGGLVRLAERLGSADGFKEENRIFPQGLKHSDGGSSMLEPFEAQVELKVRAPNASESEPPADWDALKHPPTTFVASRIEPEKPQGSEDSALRYRAGDALPRTPCTQLEPMISLERLRFEGPDPAGLGP